MKRRTALIPIGLATLLVAMPTHAVEAETLILTDAQITSIRDNCKTAHKTLQQLDSYDRLLRVNMSQRYTSISKRLMAQLNSRVALNGLDGTALTGTTAEYNRQIDAFAAAYSNYSASLRIVQQIDCNVQPVEFYAAIEDARVKRLEVHSASRSLNTLVQQYAKQVDEFTKQLPAKGGA